MSHSKILITGGSGFIGTNLIERLRSDPAVEIVNLDIQPPKIDAHRLYWRDIDIRNSAAVNSTFEEFRPTSVLHLAARTDLDGASLEDYSSNTLGTGVLVDSLHRNGFSGRVIFTSSMYVCQPGYAPADDQDYLPHTIYGQSKVEGERIVRDAQLRCDWFITRPTSIWGPWFGVPYDQFFRLVLSRRYANIAGDVTTKTYGYVDNVVAQYLALLYSDQAKRAGTYYMGDEQPYSIVEWANEIAEFAGYRPFSLPLPVFRMLAGCGDAFKHVGLRFPMTSFRLKNMTTVNNHDVVAINRLVREEKVSRRTGTERTVRWLQNQQ